MKTPRLLILLAGLPLGQFVSAQSANAPSTLGPSVATPDEAVKLNPFVFSVDPDDGYASTETLNAKKDLVLEGATFRWEKK